MTHSAISEAYESTRQLRTALLSGSLEDLGESIPALVDAARQLRSLEERLASGDSKDGAGMRGELIELRKALGCAAWLVQNGAALQQGWARLLGSALGYTSSGDAAPLPSTAQILVKG